MEISLIHPTSISHIICNQLFTMYFWITNENLLCGKAIQNIPCNVSTLSAIYMYI